MPSGAFLSISSLLLGADTQVNTASPCLITVRGSGLMCNGEPFGGLHAVLGGLTFVFKSLQLLRGQNWRQQLEIEAVSIAPRGGDMIRKLSRCSKKVNLSPRYGQRM